MSGKPLVESVQKEAISASALTNWQFAQFARLFSDIQIFGDAATWWEQAMGKYACGAAPQAGSVLVFALLKHWSRPEEKPHIPEDTVHATPDELARLRDVMRDDA